MIGKAVKSGWHDFMRRPWYLFGISLGVFLLFAVSIGNAIVTAMAYILYGGYIAALLNHHRGGTVRFDDMIMTDKRWISFAFLALIKGLFIMLGLMCFVVPGVYLATRWMFAEMFVIDKGMKPLEALKASSALTEGNRFKLFGFIILSALIMLLSVFVLVIGFVAGSLVVTFAMIALYGQLQRIAEEAQRKEIAEEVPSPAIA